MIVLIVDRYVDNFALGLASFWFMIMSFRTDRDIHRRTDRQTCASGLTHVSRVTTDRVVRNQASSSKQHCRESLAGLYHSIITMTCLSRSQRYLDYCDNGLAISFDNLC